MRRLPFLALALALCSHTSGQVLREGYDQYGTSSNPNETSLTVQSVPRLVTSFTVPVDDSVFAQLLFVPGVAIGGAAHDVVYAATMSDSLYALDAYTGAVLWHASYGRPVSDQVGIPTYGINGTPLVQGGSIYFVTATMELTDTYRIHDVDVTTGKELLPSVVISGSNQGVTFDPTMHMQRPGLALAGGNLIVGFGSYGDNGTYHGWLFSYDTSLRQKAILCLTPAGTDGGVWMAGRAPVVDSSGNIYIQVANGDYDGRVNFGETFLKLGSSLAVEDWLIPAGYVDLNAADQDTGSSGPLLVPGGGTLIGGGKPGNIYVLGTGGMRSASQIVANPGGGDFDGGIFNGGAYYNEVYYIWPNVRSLQGYRFNGASLSQLSLTATDAFGVGISGQGDSYSASLAVSSNGGAQGSTLVWAAMPVGPGDEEGNSNPAILRAFDASTFKQVWSSGTYGLWSKFRSPLVASGHVYLGTTAPTTSSGASVIAYGLPGPSPPAAPTNLKVVAQ